VSIGEVTAVTFALQAFVTLFVIMDPPGSIPIFLGLVSDKSPATRRKLAWQAAAVSMVVITSFALFGRLVLSYLNISLESLQAAGGLLLLIVSLELLMGGRQGSENKKSNNIALVPLGTPLLAGPGAIVATMIFVQKIENVGQGVAIIAVHLAIALTLMASTTILKVIKETGVNLVASIAGLLLAAIAIQMIADAIKAFTAA
jgi:multiple antibiotic resistance protein